MCDIMNDDSMNAQALSEDENDIIMCKPHGQYVSGLHWMYGTPTACPHLLTCSYDGSVVLLDVKEGKFILIHADKENEYSAMGVTPDGCTAYLGDPQVRASALFFRKATSGFVCVLFVAAIANISCRAECNYAMHRFNAEWQSTVFPQPEIVISYSHYACSN